MKNIFKNWKTSSLGITMIVGGIITMINTKAYSEAALTAILGGIGLLAAADSSSAQNAK